MMKLVFLCAFAAVAVADVSHLFNKPTFGRTPFPSYNKPTFNKPVYPVQPVYRPEVPVYPAYTGPQIKILRDESDIKPDGSYYWIYDTENGISAQEQGSPKNIGDKEPAIVATGSYKFVSPEGVPVEVQYVADENGFQPQGNVLPTPPPIPDAILRSLQYNAANEKPEPVKPGRYY